MTPLEKTMLSHRVAYGIELLSVHTAWMHECLHIESHQFAVEAHRRARAVWKAIDEAMEKLGADLRSAEAIAQSAAEYRADHDCRPPNRVSVHRAQQTRGEAA